jgi:polyketide synthase 12/myxalamid-type polyketide synthase MxaB
LSINWGAWSSVGAAARGGVGGRLAQRGIGEITPEEGLAAFEQLLAWPRPQVAVMPIDWSVYAQQFESGATPAVLSEVISEPAPSAVRAPVQPHSDLAARLAAAAPAERRTLLLELLRSEVIKGLGLDAGKQIPINEPLIALGVDSLLAVELRNALSSALGLARRLPATLLFDYPSMSALADYLLAHVSAGDTTAPSTAPEGPAPAADEAAIAALSDAEAEALLLKELG